MKIEKPFFLFLTSILTIGTLFFSQIFPSFADNTTPIQPITTQDDMQSKLNKLLREHTIVGGIAFIARYENSAYLPQLQQAVQQNTDQLTSSIGQFYGQDKQDTFKNLWTAHIDLLNQYTDARRDKNDDLANQTNQQLQNTENGLADFFAQNNQSQRDAIKQTLQMHIGDEEAIIDLHASGKESDEDLINLFLQSINHVDTLTTQIIQTQPLTQ